MPTKPSPLTLEENNNNFINKRTFVYALSLTTSYEFSEDFKELEKSILNKLTTLSKSEQDKTFHLGALESQGFKAKREDFKTCATIAAVFTLQDPIKETALYRSELLKIAATLKIHAPKKLVSKPGGLGVAMKAMPKDDSTAYEYRFMAGIVPGKTGFAKDIDHDHLKTSEKAILDENEALRKEHVVAIPAFPFIKDKHYEQSNTILWPLFHGDNKRLSKTDDLSGYEHTNKRYAEAFLAEVAKDILTLPEAERPQAIIFSIQDYQLLATPKYMKESLETLNILNKIKVSIGYFHHIPFPNIKRAIFPQPEDDNRFKSILEALCYADAIGLQTKNDEDNFFKTLTNYEIPSKEVHTYAQPIGVPGKQVHSPTATIDPKDFIIAGGLQRTDASKGIEETLQAIKLLLQENPSLTEEFRYTFIASEARPNTAAKEYEAAVLQELKEIEQEFPGVVTKKGKVLHEEVPAFQQSLDIFTACSIADGYNIAAAEYLQNKLEDNAALGGVLLITDTMGIATEFSKDTVQENSSIEVVALSEHHDNTSRVRAIANSLKNAIDTLKVRKALLKKETGGSVDYRTELRSLYTNLSETSKSLVRGLDIMHTYCTPINISPSASSPELSPGSLTPSPIRRKRSFSSPQN